MYQSAGLMAPPKVINNPEIGFFYIVQQNRIFRLKITKKIFSEIYFPNFLEDNSLW
jgi:hypothetical protein